MNAHQRPLTDDDAEEKPLNLDHFVAGFFIILFGLTFSFIAFASEKCYPKDRNEKTPDKSREEVGWVGVQQKPEELPIEI